MSQPALKLVEGSSVDKTKALDAALSQIERAFGKGSIMRLGKSDKSVEIETVSTGSLGLDIALGVGGLPRGRVIEIYGPESSGKTTLTLHAIAEAQKKGGICAFIDAEHAMDPIYARKLGVNLENLLISQPDTGEQALEICDTLVRSGAIDVVVIDSVAALVPRSEIEGEMGEMQPGLQARLMSQALRKLTGSISRSNTMVIFINQIRMKIGVMYGSPETTTGGNALKFYASVRLDIRRRDQGARGGGGQHDAREGCQEQGGAAVQTGRVRHHVRRGHLEDGRVGGSWRQGRHRRKVGRMVLPRFGAHRAGPRERQDVPQGEPRNGGQDRADGPPELRADRREDPGHRSGGG
jgi:protein RecA